MNNKFLAQQLRQIGQDFGGGAQPAGSPMLSAGLRGLDSFMQARQARDAEPRPQGMGGMGQMMGEQAQKDPAADVGGMLGGLAGTAFGGPVGGVVGGMAGRALGPAINKIFKVI